MTLTFDEMVGALQREYGFDRTRAEAVARKQLGLAGTEPGDAAAAERNAAVREKEEQAAVTRLFREHGFTVRSTSQARSSKIALGFPDLFATHKRLPLAFFWETKRQVGGIISDAQQEFGDDCARCGIRWYAGDRHAAKEFLDREGITRDEEPSTR